MVDCIQGYMDGRVMPADFPDLRVPCNQRWSLRSRYAKQTGRMRPPSACW